MKRQWSLAAAVAALLMGTAGCAVLAPTFKNDLTLTLQSAKPQLSHCYARALAKNPKFAGQATVSLTVERETTSLTNVTVSGPQPSDSAFEQCVALVAKQLRVPNAPHLTVRADFPLNFSPAR